MFVYILVQKLFIQYIYQIHTLNGQVQVFMYIEYKNKTLLVSEFEHVTLSPSYLNHCASSAIVIDPIVIVYVYCCTWRLLTYVWRRISSPPRPRHDFAGPSFNMDLFEAEISCEAGQESLGGADVAGVLRPDGPGGRASNLKGGWLLFTGHRLSVSCWARARTG
jgi:hypothetical protein